MSTKYKQIETEVGYIKLARDAIYLDTFEQKYNSVILKGKINTLFCEQKNNNKWYQYELKASEVVEFTAIDEDHFFAQTEIHTESSFSELIEEAESNREDKTIIFQTYDWSYIIKCKDYKFKITGYR